MKQSEKYRQEAQESDSDFRAMSLYNKSLREARLERFEDGYKELLEAKQCIVTPFNGSKIVIDTQTDKYGILDYFPKANKVLIRKKSQWKNAGLRWLQNNILKDER